MEEGEAEEEYGEIWKGIETIEECYGEMEGTRNKQERGK